LVLAKSGIFQPAPHYKGHRFPTSYPAKRGGMLEYARTLPIP